MRNKKRNYYNETEIPIELSDKKWFTGWSHSGFIGGREWERFNVWSRIIVTAILNWHSNSFQFNYHHLRWFVVADSLNFHHEGNRRRENMPAAIRVECLWSARVHCMNVHTFYTNMKLITLFTVAINFSC